MKEMVVTVKNVKNEEEEEIVVNTIVDNLDHTNMPFVELKEVLRSENGKDIIVMFGYDEEDSVHIDELMKGVSHAFEVEESGCKN